MAENVGQKESRAEIGGFGRGVIGGGEDSTIHYTVEAGMGAKHCVLMRFSQTGKVISKRFREFEPHRRVGGFRKFGGQEFGMHEEGQFAIPARLCTCDGRLKRVSADA